MMPNPAAEILDIKIALNLTDEQVGRLNILSDSIKARGQALAQRAKQAIEKAGPNPDPGATFAAMRPLLQAIRDANASALKEAESILTADQWRQVPDRIKTPRQGFGRGRAGPPGGR
jgi:hypothetical protein